MRIFSRSLVTILVAVVAGGLAVGACLAALIPGTVEIATGHHYTAEQVGNLKALAQPSKAYWNDGVTELGTLATDQNRSPITSLDEVPEMVQNAVIATEDRSFWTNDGIDLGAVFRAFLTNVTSGEIEQGGSTITQQLVKNRILSPKRDVNRKIKEIQSALRLNDKFSKEKILVEYLNTVYFGSGSYGLKAAASRFFYTFDPGASYPRGKRLDELTLGEAALLAGVISSPEGNNPFNYQERAIRRRADVLRGMVEEKYITQAEADAANNEPPPKYPPPPDQRPDNFLVAEVQRLLLADPRLGATPEERKDRVLKGGLKVYTTFDQHLQSLADDATTNAKPASPSGPDWISSLVAIEPATGFVRAMVGGDDFAENQYNVATSDSGRQTGSTFKVITLAAALMNGYSPKDQVSGTDPCPVPSRFPAVPPDQYPTNSDGDEDGNHTIDYSTARSINCAFVRIATSVGLDKVIATAHAMGVTKDNLVPLLNLTLGTREQNTLTMATVMATIANRGVHHAPVMVERVLTPDGQWLIDETTTAGDPAVPMDVADCMQTVLSHTVTAGTGGNARVGGQTIFGKTGTTDNTTDAWFIGANPGGAGRQLATAVWFGNRTGAVPRAGFGGTNAAPVFQAFMSAALAGEAAAGLPAPGPVCARSGSFVNPDGGRTTINPSAPVEPAPPALPTAQEQSTEPTAAAVPEAAAPGNSGQ